jgi:hypothetical protein
MKRNMRSHWKHPMILLIIATITLYALGAYAGNIDPDSNGCKFAWAENVGWINFNPSQGPGVTVTDTAVTGMAWGENIGWINLNPTNGGVVNDGRGNLSGYAWGENVGWINLKPANGGVIIGSDGKFSGYAWGENIGWINFSTANSCVKTSWVSTPLIDDGNPCTIDAYDPVTGNVTHTPVTNGTLCDDNNLCTVNDICTNGTCAGTPVVCNDNNVCTGPDHCDSATGLCVFPPLSGTLCDDGDKCTTNDVCTNGVCAGTPVVCNDNNVCTGPDHCDSATGLCVFPLLTGTTCDDGDKCTTNDVCANGVCAGTAIVCNDNNVCTGPDHCDPATGLCVYPPLTGTACDDGNKCTTNDVCANGVCAGTAIVCNDNNVCTGPDHCDPATGLCVYPLLTGTACDDGNKCTTNDVCANGVCAGTPVVCNDNNHCTGPDHCDSATGLCVFPLLTGTACDDGSPCTENDVCTNGTCAGTPKPDIFFGFFNPVDNPPNLNMSNSGQTIPVKWRITDACGVPVSDPLSFKSLTSYLVNCNTYSGDATSAIEEYSAGSSGLQYLGDGNWQFNWKTSKTYAGQCRMMVLTLGDKSTHTADFKFK